jgi:LPS-assembly lipoprotein
MSLAETGPARVILSRRSLVRALSLVLAMAPVLAACGSSGIRPLYGSTPSGAGLQERLAQLDVAVIPGRIGQRIRNELIFQSSGGGELAPPTHRLEVSITESVLSTLVKTDGDALGQTYSLQANFKLIEIKSKNIVLTGTSHGRAGFERFQSIYSNVRARDDAENRAARTVADDLKTRVSIYLSGQA